MFFLVSTLSILNFKRNFKILFEIFKEKFLIGKIPKEKFKKKFLTPELLIFWSLMAWTH